MTPFMIGDMRRLMQAWGVVAIVAFLYLSLSWSVSFNRGLTRIAAFDTSPAAPQIAATRVDTIDFNGLGDTLAARSTVAVSWRGVWEIPASDFYTLYLESRGPSFWHVDGQLAQRVASSGRAEPRVLWLTSGFHTIAIVNEVDTTAPMIAVGVARHGHPQRAIDPDALKPQFPRNPLLRRVTQVLTRGLVGLLVILILIAVRRTVSIVKPHFDGLPARNRSGAFLARLGRAPAWTLLAGILLYGAVLRLDAITARYGPVTSPPWLAAVQTRSVLPPLAIRPDWFPWVAAPVVPHADGPPSRYISDPYTYLTGARKMQSLYDAQWREPAFMFAVKLILPLLNQQDVAVSFASTAFAVLAIWFTYLLGAAVWSRPAGLTAALLLAIDRDAAWFSSAGWRDDAYVAAVALGAWLILRCWRSLRAGPRSVRIGSISVEVAWLDAIALGAAAGFICLVRIMAVSFLAPTALVLLLTARGSWRRRLTLAGAGVLTAVLVGGPYFINCWRTFGDPLYTFNVHGNIYRIAEGRAQSSGGTLSYVREKAMARPVATIDTIAQGLTLYPFNNKWEGLEAWRYGLGSVVAVAAGAGLVILAFLPAGRLFLLVAVTSLIPFSFTWRVDPNWRFTAHVYPFLLIAAAVATAVVLRILLTAIVPGQRVRIFPGAALADSHASARRAWIAGAAPIVAVGVVLWFVLRVSPQLVFAEQIANGEDGTIAAASPGRFFGPGWLPGAVGAGNFRMRVSGDEAVLRFQLPAVGDYRMILRVDPFPRPLADSLGRQPMVEVALNGTAVGGAPLGWNPERIGALTVTLPRADVRIGINELTIRLRPSNDSGPRVPGLTEADAFGLWVVRVFRLPG